MSNFVDLKSRCISNSVCILALIGLLCFAENRIVQLLVVMMVSLLAVIALWEYANLLKSKQIDLPIWLLGALAVIYLFANYLAVLNWKFSVGVGFAVVAFFVSIFLYNFFRIEGAITRIASSLFGILYIVIPLGFMFRILYPESIGGKFDDGRVWLAYLISVTKITDIGAYFIGKLWGKTKLAPHLSPGKTVLGAFGGFFSALVLSLIFYFMSPYCPRRMFHISLLEALVLGGCIGIFSQLGDLAESLLKRDAKIKDSNHIPGVGGALDLLDSLLFTAPIVYLFLKVVYL